MSYKCSVRQVTKLRGVSPRGVKVKFHIARKLAAIVANLGWPTSSHIRAGSGSANLLANLLGDQSFDGYPFIFLTYFHTCVLLIITS